MTHPSSPQAPMTAAETSGSCYPLQEVLRTAFPDLKFTTMQVMNMHLDLEQRFGQFIGRKSERDALTARVAELERERDEAREGRITDEVVLRHLEEYAVAIREQIKGGLHRFAGMLRGTRFVISALHDRADKAESELAAARKVEDGEIASAIAELNQLGWKGDEGEVGPRCADLLTRLSAALKEAEARETDAKTLQHQLASDLTVAVARALQTKDTTP